MNLKRVQEVSEGARGVTAEYPWPNIKAPCGAGEGNLPAPAINRGLGCCSPGLLLHTVPLLRLMINDLAGVTHHLSPRCLRSLQYVRSFSPPRDYRVFLHWYIDYLLYLLFSFLTHQSMLGRLCSRANHANTCRRVRSRPSKLK